MKAAVSRVWPPPPSAVIVGGLVGMVIALSWSAISEWANAAYDSVFPIISVKSHSMHRANDSAILTWTFKKNRGCTFERVQAYGVHPGEVRVPMRIDRIDGALTETRPVGATVFGGKWEAWPVDGAYAVSVYTQHDCDGRLVSTHLFTERL